MRPALRLSKGEQILAEVIELQSGNFLLVQIEGYLFRVKNESGLSYSLGSKIHLTVQQDQPLVLKLTKGMSSSLDRLV